MTIEEFEKAQLQDDETWIIRVTNHKTFASHGPAMVVLVPWLYESLETFVKYVRPKTHPECANVFVSWCGKSMESGAISRQIHSLFVKAGALPEDAPKNMSCNIIRKSVSTEIRNKNAGNLKESADLMAHALATQEKHYVLQNKAKSAKIGGASIRNVFGTNLVCIYFFCIQRKFSFDEKLKK